MALREELCAAAAQNGSDGALQGLLAGEALLSLGLMYASGRSVEPNLIEAHKWFNLAAQRGCEEAIGLRAEIAREMSRSDVAEAQRRARGWLATH